MDEAAVENFGARFKDAALRIFGAAWFWWVLAAVFGLRVILLGAAEPHRPDPANYLSAARALLTSPTHIYADAAAWLSLHHEDPPPGSLLGFITLPPAGYLFLPLASLSDGLAVRLWTLMDAGCLVAALLVLDRRLALRGPGRAVFWFLAAVFPPLFAEIDAGQITGLQLLLACLSMAVLTRQPILSGALAGLAASFKVYPASLAIGIPPRLRARHWISLLTTFVVVVLASFLPLGWDRILFYVDRVLVPGLSPQNPDCALVSVPALLSRYVGGAAWKTLATGQLTVHHLPWAFPAAAAILSLLATAGGVLAVVWGARASGYQEPYSVTLALALGAIFTGEAFPYQLLLLLPVLLVVAARALDDRRPWPLVVVGLAILAMVRPPCAVVVPNLWTLGGLLLFGLAVQQGGRLAGPRPS